MCVRRWGSLQPSQNPLAGFGEGNSEGEMERARNGKGTEGGANEEGDEKREGEGRGEGTEGENGNWGGVCFIDFGGYTPLGAPRRRVGAAGPQLVRFVQIDPAFNEIRC